MTTYKLGQVNYNFGRGAHEARVDLIHDGRVFRYPCEMPGPCDLDDGLVRDGLLAHALRMTDSGWSQTT